MEWIQAEHEYGTTMPVVPRIEIPPTIPSLGFQVFRASRSPSATEISMATSGATPAVAATSSTTARIIRLGTGLMAGSPTATGNPGRVTVPTPGPARKTTPSPAPARRTVARINARWVTSGSSPASLTTPADAASRSSRSVASANAGCCPLGRVTSTGSGNSPVSSAVKAALVAAVAQAPVVQPRRSGTFGLRAIGHCRQNARP